MNDIATLKKQAPAPLLWRELPTSGRVREACGAPLRGARRFAVVYHHLMKMNGRQIAAPTRVAGGFLQKRTKKPSRASRVGIFMGLR